MIDLPLDRRLLYVMKVVYAVLETWYDLDARTLDTVVWAR
jgi:hypothetical protein